MLGVFGACSSDDGPGSGGNAGTGASSGTGGSAVGGGPGTGGGIAIDGGACAPTTCAALGWACGIYVDECGNTTDCAAEGLSCDASQACVGGIDGPTECVAGTGGPCELCSAIPDCRSADQVTRLTGRVITPGRDDENTANQVGVPNAVVYILRNNRVEDLPPIAAGLPSGETSCDRCEDQDLGPVLAGAVTDATGSYVLEGNIPVGVEFLLVVKAGKFRRAVPLTLEADAACKTTALPSALPDNPTRLPRTMSDGLAVNIPRIAISTGQIDAMECVFEKMGLSHDEFGNPGPDGAADNRVHVYRGGSSDGPAGARIDDETPHDAALYGELGRLEQYDLVVADCEGLSWDSSFNQRDAQGAAVREYVNRGGRLFASHLSFSWLHGNGTEPYAETSATETGLAAAAEWESEFNLANSGTGRISLGRPLASPRIEGFADWMASEGITTAPDHTFNIVQPRSQALSLGPATEEFVHIQDARVQQFSLNTPYGAPPEAACGRVAYSGFHVTAGTGTEPYIDAVFPEHCTGDLTDQEKVLLYMLFDLGACVGAEPPSCVPATCEGTGTKCGFVSDGCGGVLDCGRCKPPA